MFLNAYVSIEKLKGIIYELFFDHQCLIPVNILNIIREILGFKMFEITFIYLFFFIVTVRLTCCE